jgi:hypothetical protein
MQSKSRCYRSKSEGMQVESAAENIEISYETRIILIGLGAGSDYAQSLLVVATINVLLARL